MKNPLLLGLLAGTALLLTVTSCSNPDYQQQDEIVVKPLPPLPPVPDTTGGKVDPNSPRELNAANATEDIKKMQPQM